MCISWVTLLCPSALGQEATGNTATVPQPLITQPVDESQLTTLTGNTYPLAKPQYDLGAAPASLPMERMLLVLKRSPEQEFVLRTLLDDQQDKASPNYHKWLTPEQVGQEFGPTDTDMQTITTWLQSHGFQVGSTKGRTVLEFSGSASQVQETFHTAIHKYLVNGEQHWANSSDPQIPTALTPAVAGIDSLHNFSRKAMNRFVGTYSEKTKSLTVPGPNYTVACGSGQTCYAVSPYDFATIYDVLPLWNASPAIDGTGQTIAIVGRTDIYAQDAMNFWQLFGLTVPANKLNIIYNGVYSEINGDEGEADIDVQWSGAVAPQATIDFVDSASTETTDGVDLSAVYIVDNNLAPVMSESYGECELGLGTAGNQFYYTLWEQAAAQGISVFVSTGDNGSAACDNPGTPAKYGLNVNGIASTPFNAAVGGTDFNQYNTQTQYWTSSNGTNEESAKGYIPEVAWNNSCANPWALTSGLGSTAEQVCNNPELNSFFLNSTGGSGGPSNCAVNTQAIGSCTQKYPKPSWQKGTGVPNDSSRDLPDVSLFASNGVLTGSFYVVCQSDRTGTCSLNAFAGYGGTSVASPAFAGIMALVNQKMGVPQGVPGFALYQVATKQTNAFHDVPTGSTIAMPCVTGSPNCTTNTAGHSYGVLSGYSTGTGYDLATGLGSVDAANLVNNWSKATFTATTTTLTLGSGGKAVNVTHGTPVAVSIDVSPTASTGTASLLVSNQTGTTIGQGIDGFALTSGATASGATTTRLPGGTNYYVMAHYLGDGTYGGSYSTPMAVTVNPENSQPDIFLVTFDGSWNVVNSHTSTAEYGSQYLLRVNVENAAGQVCSPFGAANTTACPSGTVILNNNGSPLNPGTYTLNDFGYAENRTVQLPGGTDSVTAAYSGDSSFNASTATAPITITPADTQMPPPYVFGAVVGQSATISVMVAPYTTLGAAPSGTITFYANGTALNGTVTYSTSGTAPPMLNASLNYTFTTSGNYAITATYSGDTNYTPVTSFAQNITVMYPTPNLVITPPSQTISYGGTASVTVLVDTTNTSVYPTGTVTFSGTSAGTVACTNAKDASGNFACQATGTFTVTSGGYYQVNYSGDANYPASYSMALIAMPDFTVYGSGVQLTAGQSQITIITFQSQSGLSGTVSNFGCSNLPAETTCTFNPAQVTLPGNGTVTTTLTVTTTALGQSLRQSRQRAANDASQIRWGRAQALLVLGACIIGFPFSRRRRGIRLAFLLLGLMVVFPSCGGGSGGGGGGQQNPVPVISSLNPAKVAAGSQVQSLYINGSSFMDSSTVTYNGILHNSSLQSPTQLQIAFNPDDLTSTGQYPVVVTNPPPGGGTSSPVNFNVATGTPTGVFYATLTATVGPITHTMTLPIVVQ
ncbi:MAG: Ig-like domain repeat protein [Candidatus Sulfotelmatobacter sp.]